MPVSYPKKQSFACGGKVKGHADGGKMGFFEGIVERMTRPKAKPNTEAPPPPPVREEMPKEEPVGPGMSAPTGAQKLQGIVNRNKRALKVAEEVDDPK
jgi:hypothetical protein